MKNIITIVCLVMLGIAGTQNAQAQTKEETIEWLNMNGKDFVGGTCNWVANGSGKVKDIFSLEKISNDVLRIEHWQSWEGSGTTTYYSDVSFESILYQDVSTVTKVDDTDCPTIAYFLIKTEPYKKWWMSDGKRVEGLDYRTNLS